MRHFDVDVQKEKKKQRKESENSSFKYCLSHLLPCDIGHVY